MSKRYGIVYMGSKEKILDTIKYIFEREYKKKNMIDMFCGGFSVSNFALEKTNFTVYANDINNYVIALYQEILQGSQNLNTVKFDWISRETFESVKNFPDCFPEWYVGYVLNVWSFGCNQRDYLYAKDLEESKRILHHAIVFNRIVEFDFPLSFHHIHIPENVYSIDYKKYPTEKRLAFMNYFKKAIKTETDPERLQHLERLEQLEHLSQTEHLSAINKAQKKKERIRLSSKDWQDFFIEISESLDPEETFIYCDPPYENTKQYQFGEDFDYTLFWEWFRKTPYSVYVSSYTAPDDIKPLNFALKQVNLDNGNRSEERYAAKKKAVENIYWNGKGNAEPMMIDLLFQK